MVKNGDCVRAAGITSRFVSVALVVIAAALVLSPVLATGFYGDDASDANLNGALALHRTSALQAALATALLWVEANGRLFPLYVIEKYAVFHLLPGVVAYKLFLAGLTLVTLVAFLFFIGSLAGFEFAAVAALFAALSLQMRGYHDALYSYNGMIQIMLLIMFASLWCWRTYLRGGSPLWGTCAVVLYGANCLTYEFSYLFFPLYAAVSPATSPRALLRATGPFAALTLVVALTSGVLRSHAAIAAGSAYAIGGGPVDYLTALGRQLAAALPLSYYGWNPSQIFPALPQLFDRSGGYAFSLWAALFFALVALLVMGSDRDVAARGGLPMQRLAWFGAGLWVLPALLVALSAKYQRELTWGIGYLPVLIELFGVALLLGLCAVAVLRALPPGAARSAGLVVLAAICGMGGAITLADNRRLALELTPWRVSRSVLASALAQGVASAVPDGSTLGIGGALPWMCLAQSGCPDDLDTGYFIYANAGKQVALAALPAGDADYVLRYGSSPRLAWVAVARPAGTSAAVYLQALRGDCVLAGAARGSAVHGPNWNLAVFSRLPGRLETACGTVDFGRWPG